MKCTSDHPQIQKHIILQLEFTSTAIAMLVTRGNLYCRSAQGEHYFSDMDDFLSSSARHFYARQSTLPFFRTGNRGWQQTEDAQRGSRLQRQLRNAAIEVRLPHAKSYNFRRNVGSGRLTARRLKKPLSFMMRQGTYPGRRIRWEYKILASHERYWQNGMRLMAGVKRISTAATTTCVKKTAEPFIASFSCSENLAEVFPTQVVSEEELTEALHKLAEFVQLLRSYLVAEESKSHVSAESTTKMRERLQSIRHDVRSSIVLAKGQAQRGSNDVGPRAVHGTIAEYERAKVALDKLSSSLSLHLTVNSSHAFDGNSDFVSFWQDPPPHPAADKDRPYPFQMEDEGLFDDEAAGFRSRCNRVSRSYQGVRGSNAGSVHPERVSNTSSEPSQG